MNGQRRTAPRPNWWGLALSGLLHAAACAFILLLPPPSQHKVFEERSIDVEIVTAPQNGKGAQEKTGGQPNDEIEPAGDGESKRDDIAAPAMVKATRMLSGDVLVDARSREAREELSTLLPTDQVEQLCGLEAMAQVSAWSDEIEAEYVRIFAIGDPVMAGDVLTADGAALQSKRQWYRLQFRCTLAPDHASVTGFEFRLGDLIPRDRWPEYNLHDEYEDH